MNESCCLQVSTDNLVYTRKWASHLTVDIKRIREDQIDKGNKTTGQWQIWKAIMGGAGGRGVQRYSP